MKVNKLDDSIYEMVFTDTKSILLWLNQTLLTFILIVNDKKYKENAGLYSTIFISQITHGILFIESRGEMNDKNKEV
ncbi:hypothetical protein RI065_10125 [Mycoplasmatota bacterium zrk1]